MRLEKIIIQYDRNVKIDKVNRGHVTYVKVVVGIGKYVRLKKDMRLLRIIFVIEKKITIQNWYSTCIMGEIHDALFIENIYSN